MNYCSNCGRASLVEKIPEGDNHLRIVCENCHTIHYQNPKMVAGCLPEWEDKILLCKRAIEPRYGLWTLPAGFMENQESLEQAAVRETWEEAQARVASLSLYVVMSLSRINQVFVMFRAQLQNLEFAPGAESLEVKLFTQDEIPWEQLAFPVVRRILTHYYQDQLRGQFPVHVEELLPPPFPTVTS